MFSGFYLPLLLILVALIVRGVAFEYRGKRADDAWRARWDLAIIVGSLLPALLWGVAFANIVRGVPIDADNEYAGGLVDLLNPYALLGGVTTLRLFVLHGAVFVALKTDGRSDRARELAAPGGSAAALALWGSWPGPSDDRHGASRSLGGPRLARGRPARRSAGPRGLGVRRHRRRDRRSPWSGCSPRSSPRDADHARAGTPDGHQRGGQGVHAEDHDLWSRASSPRSCCSTRAGPTGCSASGSRCTTSPRPTPAAPGEAARPGGPPAPARARPRAAVGSSGAGSSAACWPWRRPARSRLVVAAVTATPSSGGGARGRSPGSGLLRTGGVRRSAERGGPCGGRGLRGAAAAASWTRRRRSDAVARPPGRPGHPRRGAGVEPYVTRYLPSLVPAGVLPLVALAAIAWLDPLSASWSP